MIKNAIDSELLKIQIYSELLKTKLYSELYKFIHLLTQQKPANATKPGQQ